MGAWQRFFCGGNLATDVNSAELVRAADRLFRVACSLDSHENYRHSKTAEACKHLGDFARTHGLDYRAEELAGRVPLFELIQAMNDELPTSLVLPNNLRCPDTALLRLMISLLDWLRKCFRTGKHLRPAPIDQPFQEAARDYLSTILELSMGWELPDRKKADGLAKSVDTGPLNPMPPNVGTARAARKRQHR
jgi:hypothetical protein